MNAPMGQTYDIHALHISQELPISPASKLKNSFKTVFQKALDSGAISITRNRKREAVLLSADLYDSMIAELAARDPLKVLRQDYDARFASMQTEEAQQVFEDAFSASPASLGETAVVEVAKKH